MRRQIESLGANLVVVLPGAVVSGGVRSGFGSASTLTVANTQAIRREAGSVGLVSYLTRQTTQVQYGNHNWTTNAQAVSVNYPPVANWSSPVSLVAVAVGFLFSAAVCVFFGYYPAGKAAHFDPIQALRHE